MSVSELPFSGACENNKDPILKELSCLFDPAHKPHKVEKVLEIGSGTGQHAVHFAEHLPHLQWQTADRKEYHPGIRQWLDAYPRANLNAPIALDVTDFDWPTNTYDAVFSANTAHIMPWSAVEKMFAGVSWVLPQSAPFVLYGPFNYEGRFTSDSNARFDEHLRAIAPHQGIRDMADIHALAERNLLKLAEDIAMPANNRLLVFRRL